LKGKWQIKRTEYERTAKITMLLLMGILSGPELSAKSAQHRFYVVHWVKLIEDQIKLFGLLRVLNLSQESY
jgi:hypothetical protein